MKIGVKHGGSCAHCGKTSNLQNHHVTYQPELKVRICYRCHQQITAINTVMAQFLGRKLDNDLRTRIWSIFQDIPKTEWGKNSILRVA